MGGQPTSAEDVFMPGCCCGLSLVSPLRFLPMSPLKVLPSVLFTEARPQDSLKPHQPATNWLVPTLPSGPTDPNPPSNAPGENPANGITNLREVAANRLTPANGMGAKAPFRTVTNGRSPASAVPAPTSLGSGGLGSERPWDQDPQPLSQSMTRAKATLRRLRAMVLTKGIKIRIRLTSKGLAQAKAAALKVRRAQGNGVQPGASQAMVPQNYSKAHHGFAPETAPLSKGPETPPQGSKVSVASVQILGGPKPQPLGQPLTSLQPTGPQSSQSKVTAQVQPAVNSRTPSHSNSGITGKTAQAPRKRLHTKAQSVKAGPKGVYTEDSIRVYLQEIGRIRLLRPDEEIELARKIADLLYLEQQAETYFHANKCYPSLNEWADHVEMPYRSFKKRLKLGRRAKEKMVQSNLRLVVSIAKKYMNRGLSFQDLIQEGSLGLVRAAEKFDHEKGYKFSTYATWWIRQAITRAIADQSRTIRLPVHLYETISRIKKSTKTLSQELGRKPSEEEIAERMEMTIEKLRFIAKSAQLPISLETPIGKEEDSRLGDFIEAGTENPDQDVAKNLLREDLESVLATLSPRERDVLRLRYGLDDGRMKTLEDIGQIFEVTRERIRQIEAKALRKLRHPNRNGVLKEYIK